MPRVLALMAHPDDIEITCAPEMHRDYQLLLDLRDGLPRVLAQEVPVIRERKAPTARTQGVGEGDTGSERRSHRRHGRISTVAAESGRSADAMESSSDSTAQPVRSRARGLPGARNVLKLSQSDLDIGKKPAAGLRRWVRSAR